MPIKKNPVDKLKDTYLHWTNKQLEQLHFLLHLLESGDLKSVENLGAEIFELAHNIKGLGGSFGYYLMTDIGASLCEYIRHTENIATLKTHVIAAHIHAMDMVASEGIEGSGGERGQEIFTHIQDTIAQSAFS